jgi:hypothetical protein
MAHDARVTADNSTDKLTLVVNPDDIIEAMKRNARDAETRRSHRLRVNRPLEGRVEASNHVQEQGNYWPNPETAPLTLQPEVFLPNPAPEETAHPEQWEIYEAAMDVDDVDEIDDVSDEALEECWEVHLDFWESAIRHHLKDEVDLNEYNYGPNVDSHVVPVEYEKE